MKVRVTTDFGSEHGFVRRTGLDKDVVAQVFEGIDAHGNSSFPDKRGRVWIACPEKHKMEVSRVPTDAATGKPIEGAEPKIIEVEKSAGYYQLQRGEYHRMYAPDEEIVFRPVRPRISRFVGSALRLEGVEFHKSNTQIEWKDGQPFGHCSCVGLVFMALQLVRLLPDGFDMNLSPENFGGARPAKTLWKILHRNARQRDKETVRVGDIGLLRYKHVRNDLERPHHVGIITNLSPLTMIHASSLNLGGNGRVKTEVIDPKHDPLLYDALEEIWRIPALRD